jgi:hypothetical protein
MWSTTITSFMRYAKADGFAQSGLPRDQLFPRRAYARAFEALLARGTESKPVGS